MQADGVARACKVAEVAHAPVFIVHVSCEAAMIELQRSRDAGNPRLRRNLHAIPLP